MADNLTINVASGTAVAATDQDPSAPNAHVQVVKLASGTADSFVRIAGTAKGVQMTSPDVALAVQAVKDTGRTPVILVIDTFPITASAETLINTMTSSEAFAAATTGLSDYTVPSGKTLRVQAIVAGISTTTGNQTAVGTQIRGRANASGSVTTSSPVFAICWVSGQTAPNAGGGTVSIPVPDGLEFPAGAHLGFTEQCPGFVTTTAAPRVSLTLVGYHY